MYIVCNTILSRPYFAKSLNGQRHCMSHIANKMMYDVRINLFPNDKLLTAQN